MRLQNHIISTIFVSVVALFFACLPTVTTAQANKPNIVVIFGDDIGYWNVSAYNHGLLGWTPNIDSIAKNGILFTDHYGQPSCTAGRAAFLMGQLPIRTGMTTVGIPGSTRGIQKTDPTLAEVLKPLGYATAQFGKNHLVRQSVPPERGRRTGRTRLPWPEESCLQAEIRAARRAALLGHQRRRSLDRPQIRTRWAPKDRRHGTTHPEANGNDRCGSARRNFEVDG